MVHVLRFLLMNEILISFLLFIAPSMESRPQGVVGQCDDPGVNTYWSKAQRKETRARVQAVCKAVKASPIICAYMDVIVVRESSGRAGVAHTLGKNEKGIGAMGLSTRWHHDKWPGKDENPMFCQPEVSAVVALAIMWRAVTHYGAQNVADLQAIYGGYWSCDSYTYEDPKTGKIKKHRSCWPSSNYERRVGICRRMEDRGYSCESSISKRYLGKKIKFGQRRKFALDLAAKFGKEAKP